MVTCIYELFRLLMAVWISLLSSPHSFHTFVSQRRQCLCVSCWKPSSHASLSSHSSTLSSSMFLKILIAHTMSRISDLLISLLGKPRKSSSSRSGRSFHYDRISVTWFTEDNAWNMPYVASNTIIFFHNAIMLSSSARVVRRSAQ
jgi:hypothetical protein